MDLKITVIPIRIPTRFFMKFNYPTIKFTWKIKGTKLAKRFLKKKTKEWRFALKGYCYLNTVVLGQTYKK